MKTKIFILLLVLVASAEWVKAAVYSGDCGAEGSNVTWVLNTQTGVLTISGNGAMKDYGYYEFDAPWQPYKSYITSVIINYGVTTIGTYAFQECTSIKNVSIPNGIIVLGHGAFKQCSGIIHVTIPESVTRLTDGGTSFQFCTNLQSVIWNAISCVLEAHPNGGFVPPFENLSNITTFVFGENVHIIPRSLCNGLTGLTSIEFPASVTEIGPTAFNNCTGLTSIICKAITPPTLENDVFSGVDKTIPLYVPDCSITAYKTADQWKDFSNILSIPCAEHQTYTITWQDEDRNVIKTDKVENGTTPAYTGTPLTKVGYDFVGWLPNIKPATEDTKYTTYFIPQSSASATVYTVNINGENCSLNINNQYPEGTVITIEAVADECFEFQKWSDGETANPRTVTVTKDMNLTAEFNKLHYTITSDVDSSTGGKVQIHKQ